MRILTIVLTIFLTGATISLSAKKKTKKELLKKEKAEK